MQEDNSPEKPALTAAQDKAAKILAGIVIFLILAVVGVLITKSGSIAQNISTNTDASASSEHSTYAADVTDFVNENPASKRIFVEVKNMGSTTGKPSCTVNAFDSSRTYKGYDIVDDPNNLSPGDTWSFAINLTITNEGAAYADQVTAVCN